MKRNELGRLFLALGFIGGMFMQVEAKKNAESGAKSAKAQKLELTWVGKDQKIAVEPRIRRHHEEISSGNGRDFVWLDVIEDNLLALARLGD